MNVAHAKRAARNWFEHRREDLPGLREAHFNGSVTSMPDAAPFPPHKDVDLHLIVDEASPLLTSDGPSWNIFQESWRGVAIEAGVKSVVDYASPEAVLGNPEIAFHLTTDSVLDDPCGLLRDLLPTVRREYPRRRWVEARLAHERAALQGALAMRSMAFERWGASGEANLLGYSTTFPIAALWVATLQPPRMGGQMFRRVGRLLAANGRPDLHERLLAILGLDRVGPDQVERYLEEAADGFAVALDFYRTPIPFSHKLRPHLLPVFLACCRNMIDEGHHREALGWTVPFYLVAADIIKADGATDDRTLWTERQERFLEALGLLDDRARAERFAAMEALHAELFALADDLAARHPGVIA